MACPRSNAARRRRTSLVFVFVQFATARSALLERFAAAPGSSVALLPRHLNPSNLCHLLPGRANPDGVAVDDQTVLDLCVNI
jgi:hypothetical protein